jgi:exodeoxyribonuclease VII large subunit
MLGDLWLQGEVSNCKYHHSGHIYFTIKDERASISAVMFARDATRLGFKLLDGISIYARVRITLYEKTGAYQAYVHDIEKQGKGLLYEKFEALKKSLDQEGLFDVRHKKEIPAFPQKVGVITSITGAAIKDIVQVAGRRNTAIPLCIYPTHVQGELAIKEIVEAIQKANEEGLVDVIIVARGGGSIEDLWAFNEEKVARAIFESAIPIVSAVGHEIDFTIADFVSDKRAATPSAAAEIVFPAQTELGEVVKRYAASLNYMMHQKLKYSKEKLEYLVSRPVFKTKDKFYKDKMQEVDDLVQKLSSHYKRLLTQDFNHYDKLIGQLEQLSPLMTLKRGYSLVTTAQDKMVKSIQDVEAEQMLHITVSDGTFTAKVYEKEK